MDKEFGRINTSQLRELAALYDHLQPLVQELRENLAGDGAVKVIEKVGRPIVWSSAYEKSFHEQIAALTVVLGLAGQVQEAAGSDDPQQYILDRAMDDGTVTPPEQFSDAQRVGLTISILYTMECLFIYGVPLNTYVAMIREGNLEALRRAISIDRTVLSAPSVSVLLSTLQLSSDTDAFGGVLKAIRQGFNGPPKQIETEYNKLRYILAALHELGGPDIFEKLGQQRAHKLLCVDLGLYSDPHDPDAPESLWRFIKRWKAEAVDMT